MRLLLSPLLACCAFAAAPTTAIKVDQVGYPGNAPKIALVVSPAAAAEFTVRNASTGAIAFRGQLGAPADDPDSGDRIRAADFSRFTGAGQFYIDVPGVGQSWPFAIGPAVYTRAWYLAMRSYYGQRCGTVEKREAKRRQTLAQRKAAAASPASTSAAPQTLLGLGRGLLSWSQCPVPLTAVVNRERDEHGLTKDWVLVSTSHQFTARHIRSTYELRPAIEERHRQYKCFWNLTRMHSRAFSLVVNQALFVLLAYTLTPWCRPISSCASASN